MVGTATQQQQLSIPGLLATFASWGSRLRYQSQLQSQSHSSRSAGARLTSADNGFSRRTRSQFAVPVRGLGRDGYAANDWWDDWMVKIRAGCWVPCVG